MPVTLTDVNRGTIPGDNTGSDAFTSFGVINTNNATLEAAIADLADTETISGLWSFSNASGLLTNIIGERTAAAGVTIDGVLLKDGGVTGTLQTAAQTNITSLGTLTALQVDNININGNTISSTAGTDLLITPLAGQQIVLDGAIVIDAGVVTGVSSLAVGDASNLGAVDVYGQAGSPYSYLSAHSNTASHEPQFGFARKGGTIAVPAAIPAAAKLGTIYWDTYTTADFNAAFIEAVATVTTGNSEATLSFSTGTDGKMSLFADGHLEVYGPDGDVSEAWSDATRNQVFHVKNNTDAAAKVTFADAVDTLGAFVLSDSSADGDWQAAFYTYGGSHASYANQTYLESGAGKLFLWTPNGASTGGIFLQSTGNSGNALFIGERSTAMTNVAGYAQLWNQNDTNGFLRFLGDTGKDLPIRCGYVSIVTDNDVDSNPGVQLEHYKATAPNLAPYLWFYRADGTEASPTTLAVGDRLWQIGGDGYINAAWSTNTTHIEPVLTVATGNGEPTLQFSTGTSGKMSLFADGHLEVYGPNGNVSQAWSGPPTTTSLWLKNNNDSWMDITFLDGTTGAGGLEFSDSSADGQGFSGVIAYGGAHSSEAGNLAFWSADRLRMLNTVDCDNGLFIYEKAAALTNRAGYGQIWVENQTPSRMHLMADDGYHSNVNVRNLSARYINVIPTDTVDDDGTFGTGIAAYGAHSTPGNSPYLWLYKSRGTYATPGNLSAGDVIGELGWDGYINGSWSSYAVWIRATTTVATGEGECTLSFNTGTSGEMALFADGHLEVYGPDGNVSPAWSSSGREFELIMAINNGPSYFHALCADGTATDAGFVMSDSSADGDWIGSIYTYAGSHSTRPHQMYIDARYGDIIMSCGAGKDLVVESSSGATIYIKEKSAASADVTGYGQIWIRSSDGALMYTSDSGVDRVVQTA